MFANSFPDRAEMAKLTARMLWEVDSGRHALPRCWV